MCNRDCYKIHGEIFRFNWISMSKLDQAEIMGDNIA